SPRNQRDSPSTFVRIVETSSAEEFFEALSPTGPFFRDSPIGEISIFRGVPDASFALVPTALRLENTSELKALAQIPECDLNFEVNQCACEFSVLAHYYRIADAQGLIIPEDTRELRSLFQHRDSLSTAFLDFVQKPIGKRWLPDNHLA